MKAQRFLILFLCIILLVTLTSCDEEQQLEDAVSFLKEHTVFQTEFRVTFEKDEDKNLFEKRLGYFGAEIQSVQDSTYTVLSHDPFIEEVVCALTSTADVKIFDKNGNDILSPSDILDIQYNYPSVQLIVQSSFAEKDVWGACKLLVDGVEYKLWTSTETTDEQCVFDCILDSPTEVIMCTFAMSVRQEHYAGKVDMVITQASQRVTDKMQS